MSLNTTPSSITMSPLTANITASTTIPILATPPPPLQGDVGNANSTITTHNEIIIDGAQHVNTTPSSTALLPSTLNITTSTPLLLLVTPPPPLQGTVMIQLFDKLGYHLSTFASSTMQSAPSHCRNSSSISHCA